MENSCIRVGGEWEVYCICISENYPIFFSGCFNQIAKNNLETGKIQGEVNVDGGVWRMCLSKDESILFAGMNLKGSILTVDVKNMLLVSEIEGQPWLRSLKLIKPSGLLISRDSNGLLRFIDAKSEKTVNHISDLGDSDALTLNSSQTKAFLCNSNSKIVELDLVTLEMTELFRTFEDPFAIALSSDESYLFSAQTRINVFDKKNRKIVRVFFLGSGSIFSLFVTNDDQHLVASCGSQLCVLELLSEKILEKIDVSSSTIYEFAIKDHRVITANGNDQSLTVHSIDRLKSANRIRNSVIFSKLDGSSISLKPEDLLKEQTAKLFEIYGQLKQQQEINTELEQKIENLKTENNSLLAQVASLKQENKELKERLDKSNSSDELLDLKKSSKTFSFFKGILLDKVTLGKSVFVDNDGVVSKTHYSPSDSLRITKYYPQFKLNLSNNEKGDQLKAFVRHYNSQVTIEGSLLLDYKDIEKEFKIDKISSKKYCIIPLDPIDSYGLSFSGKGRISFESGNWIEGQILNNQLNTELLQGFRLYFEGRLLDVKSVRDRVIVASDESELWIDFESGDMKRLEN